MAHSYWRMQFKYLISKSRLFITVRIWHFSFGPGGKTSEGCALVVTKTMVPVLWRRSAGRGPGAGPPQGVGLLQASGSAPGEPDPVCCSHFSSCHGGGGGGGAGKGDLLPLAHHPTHGWSFKPGEADPRDLAEPRVPIY